MASPNYKFENVFFIDLSPHRPLSISYSIQVGEPGDEARFRLD